MFEFWPNFNLQYQTALAYLPGPSQYLVEYSNPGAAPVGQWSYLGVTYDAGGYLDLLVYSYPGVTWT